MSPQGGLVVETNSGVSAFVLAGWVSYATRRRYPPAPASSSSDVEEGVAWGSGATSKLRQPHDVPFILLGAGVSTSWSML
jgi:ammonia channel protein AmtB